MIGGAGLTIETDAPFVADNITCQSADVSGVVNAAGFNAGSGGLETTATLSIGTDSLLNGMLFVGGVATLHSGFIMDGSSRVNGSSALAFLNTSSCVFETGTSCIFQTGSFLTVGSGVPTVLGGTLAVSGNVTFSTQLVINGAGLAVTSSSSSNAFSGPVVCFDKGRFTRAPVICGPSGGGTFDPAVATNYYFSSTSAPQTYVMATSGVLDGDEVEITLQAGCTDVVHVTGVLTGALNLVNGASGDYWYAKLKYSTVLGSWLKILAVANP